MSDGGRDQDPGDEAATWFVRLAGEAASEEDWRGFERWLAASPAHVAAYERVERLWVELDSYAAPAMAAQPAALHAPSRAARPLRRRLAVAAWLLPAAAAVAAAILLGGPWLARRAAPGAALYATSPGQLRDVVLADGTKVRLDAGSRISVRFERAAREVAMADGEAAFDVAHDPSRPFLIAVGDRQVRVVGTEFDVKHRAGRLQITVLRGLVEVRPADAPAAAPTRLAAGQQLIHADGSRLSQVAQVDPGEAFGWTVGQLVYRDRPLSEVARDLSLRFGVPIRPADPQTAEIRFSGVLAADSAPAVLRRLGAFVGVRAEPSGGGYVLRRVGRGP